MFVRQGSGTLSKICITVFPGPQNLALFAAEGKGYFDKQLEIMLRIRDKIAGTWCRRIPPPEKYLKLP